MLTVLPRTQLYSVQADGNLELLSTAANPCMRGLSAVEREVHIASLCVMHALGAGKLAIGGPGVGLQICTSKWEDGQVSWKSTWQARELEADRPAADLLHLSGSNPASMIFKLTMTTAIQEGAHSIQINRGQMMQYNQYDSKSWVAG